MTPEGKLTRAVTRVLKKLKSEGLPIWWLKIHGGPMQVAGIPDLLVVVSGLSVFIELKAEGGKPSRLQLARLEEIKAAGAWTAVCSHAETVEKLIRFVVDIRSPTYAESA